MRPFDDCGQGRKSDGPLRPRINAGSRLSQRLHRDEQRTRKQNKHCPSERLERLSGETENCRDRWSAAVLLSTVQRVKTKKSTKRANVLPPCADKINFGAVIPGRYGLNAAVGFVGCASRSGACGQSA